MRNLLSLWFQGYIRNISGPLGRKIRYKYYRKRFLVCGKNVVIDEGVYFDNPKLISIKDNVWIDRNTVLTAGAFDKSSRKFKLC